MVVHGSRLVVHVLSSTFYGSKNLNAIRIFALTIILNIIILVFIIMSFSKVKFTPGLQGPQGNKGERGLEGSAGGINLCKVKSVIAQEKKALIKSHNYIDTKPPFLENV